MKKSRFLPLLTMSLILGRLAVSAQEAPTIAPETLEARITGIRGTVHLHLAGQPEDVFVPAEEGTPIESGDRLKTGDSGRVELALNGNSIIHIGENSDFKVESLDPVRTRFRLVLGHLVAKIHHLLPSHNMEFNTPTCVAAVRGTELAVEQEPGEGPSHVGVFDEGRVAVRSGDHDDVMLQPGQETAVRKGEKPERPSALGHLIRLKTEMRRVRGRVDIVSRAWTPAASEDHKKIRTRVGEQKPVREIDFTPRSGRKHSGHRPSAREDATKKREKNFHKTHE